MIKGENICDIFSSFFVCENKKCNHEEEVHGTDKSYLDLLYLTEKNKWAKLSKYVKNWHCSKCSCKQFKLKEGKYLGPISDLDFHIKQSGGLLD
jgi:hypothetical protein